MPRIALIGDADEDRFSSPTTEEEDGFFSLDQELDISKIDLSSESQESSQGTSSTATAASSVSPSPTRRLAPEPDALGNLEYKLRILPPTRHRYDRLLTQLKWRMLQGGGQCTYEIGVLDDGRCVGICPLEMRASLRVLASLAAELGATVQVKRAFTLLPKEELQIMDSVEAHEKLSDRVMATSQSSSCGCHTEDNLLVMKLQHLGLEETEGAYLLNLDSQGNDSPDTTRAWLTAAAEEKDSDKDDTDAFEEGCFTFSLSYDERATMKGLKHRRESASGRRCRYRAASAAQKRQKEAIAQRLAQEVRGEVELPPVESSEKEQQPASSKEVHDGRAAPAALVRCERVIVEAVVMRPLEETDRDFIDYSSL